MTDSPIFKQKFLDWLDDPEQGFYVTNTWDATKDVMGGRGRLDLFPNQRRILEHVLNFDPETGRFPYTTVVYSCPKKSGKTCINAAVSSWFAENAPMDTEIYVLAGDLEQASGRVLDDIKFNCNMKGIAAPTKYEIVYPETSTKIKALSKSYRSNAGSRHSLVSYDELWTYSCTTPDVECLTRDGWKTYDKLNIGDEIATWDSGEFKWGKAKAINVYNYDGDLLRLKHRRCDMFLTPNHRVLGKFKRHGAQKINQLDWEFKTAEEASQSYEGLVPTKSSWSGISKSYYEVPACDTIVKGSHSKKNHWNARRFPIVPFMKFMGYYMSEGNINFTQKNGSPCSVSIAQSEKVNPDKVQDIKDCLDALSVKWSYDGIMSFRISEPQLAVFLAPLGKSHEKYIYSDLKEYETEYLKELLMSFINGDGHVAGKGYQIFSTSPKLVDDILEIGIKCGYTVRHIKDNRELVGENVHKIYRASLSVGNVCYDRRLWSKEYYRGIVWCPTTEHGTWLARRNGCIYWTGNSEDSIRLWDEMQPIPTVPHSLRFITTYAGFYGESDLLWGLYLAGVGTDEHKDGKGKRIKGLEDLPCWSNGRLFVYWSHENEMPWQTEDFLEEARVAERPASYLRLFENRWVTSHEAFMPIEWWDEAIKGAEKVGLGKSAELWQDHPYRKAPVYVAVDAGIKRDCTAVMGVTFDARLGKCILMFHKIWKPLKDQPIDLDTTLKPFLRKVWKDFNVKEIAFDPSQLLQMKKQFEKEGMKMEEITQAGRDMVNASQLLFDLFNDQNFYAYPSEEIREHLRNSVAEQTSAGLRIVKDKSNRRMEEKKVDAAVAMAMACYRAVECSRAPRQEIIEIDTPFSDLSDNREDDSQKDLPFPLRS